ncbi:MAG: FAD-dependent oxidoreductase [Burkholderiales bacterium]|nr:FAD-dependent oxidoreductase [Burkholderiales bacterium]
MSTISFDVIVIGEGIAGLTAAGALARHGLKTATLEAKLFGGLVINVNELEPAPQEDAVSGAEFASELVQANAELGIASIQEEVTGLTFDGDIKHALTAGGSYSARHVIIASGARLKKLGVPGETELEGRGVSQCADCDGPMYQGEDVVVVGGGDSALQEALVLARFCNTVHLVHRGGGFQAQQRFIEQVNDNPKIATIWNAAVENITGSRMVEKVCVRLAGGRIQDIPCAGIFAFIGLMPNSEFLPQQIARNDTGFVVTDDRLQTSLPGVWAIGAVRAGYSGILRDAVKEGHRVAETIREHCK